MKDFPEANSWKIHIPALFLYGNLFLQMLLLPDLQFYMQ